MFRFPSQHVLAVVVKSIALASLLAITLGLRTARTQSSDPTAQAKHHYQNAVAAIEKSDWQTARNELLQAEKLAPKNALVHYDLALVYSHIGQLKSAQRELALALELGLPEDQKQAAEHLRQSMTYKTKSLDAHENTQGHKKVTAFPSVSWLRRYDKFKGSNEVTLRLRNISKNDPNYFMDIYAAWDSSEQEEKPSNRNRIGNVIAFGNSPELSADSFLPKNDAILVLDGSKRLYLTGSFHCKSAQCNERENRNVTYGWEILDLASATSIEGRVDGSEFALKTEQIAAIREFCESRELLGWQEYLNEWRGKTAADAAKKLDEDLRNHYNDTRCCNVSHLAVEALNSTLFSFSFEQFHGEEGWERTGIETVHLDDMKMLSEIWLICNKPSCAEIFFTKGASKGEKTQHSDFAGDLVAGSLKNDMAGLAYIYYRIMYWGDGLN